MGEFQVPGNFMRDYVEPWFLNLCVCMLFIYLGYDQKTYSLILILDLKINAMVK